MGSLLLVCSPGAALCWSSVCAISAWRNLYSRIKLKELERVGSERKAGLPFLGLCQWPHSFNIVHTHSDVCLQQHTFGKKFCSHLYPLYQFQGIFSLVHRKDYMILICINFFFFSFHTRGSSAIYSSVSHIRDLFLSLPLSQELCCLMKDALSSYTCILLQFGEPFSWETGQFSPGLTLLFKHAYNQCPQ